MVLSNKVESYNPFHLYVKELPEWDGIDRVLPLLLRVSDNEIWLKGGHCWLRAMLSQWRRTAARQCAYSCIDKRKAGVK